jgi:hypothetical protein
VGLDGVKIVLPGILSRLWVRLAFAIILPVTEFGVCAYILEAGSLCDPGRLFAAITMLSPLGVTVTALVGFAERRLLNWKRPKTAKQDHFRFSRQSIDIGYTDADLDFLWLFEDNAKIDINVYDLELGNA